VDAFYDRDLIGVYANGGRCKHCGKMDGFVNQGHCGWTDLVHPGQLPQGDLMLEDEPLWHPHGFGPPLLLSHAQGRFDESDLMTFTFDEDQCQTCAAALLRYDRVLRVQIPDLTERRNKALRKQEMLRLERAGQMDLFRKTMRE
jgi:hypothetical protein